MLVCINRKIYNVICATNPDGEVAILSVHLHCHHYRHGEYTRLVWEKPRRAGPTIQEVLEIAHKRLKNAGKIVEDLQCY